MKNIKDIVKSGSYVSLKEYESSDMGEFAREAERKFYRSLAVFVILYCLGFFIFHNFVNVEVFLESLQDIGIDVNSNRFLLVSRGGPASLNLYVYFLCVSPVFVLLGVFHLISVNIVGGIRSGVYDYQPSIYDSMKNISWFAITFLIIFYFTYFWPPFVDDSGSIGLYVIFQFPFFLFYSMLYIFIMVFLVGSIFILIFKMYLQN